MKVAKIRPQVGLIGFTAIRGAAYAWVRLLRKVLWYDDYHTTAHPPFVTVQQ